MDYNAAQWNWWEYNGNKMGFQKYSKIQLYSVVFFAFALIVAVGLCAGT